MRRLLWAGLLALTLGLPAHAQMGAPPTHGRSAAAKGPPPAGVSPIHWYYPDYAMRMEISGKTDLSCEVDPEGRLQDCQLLSETPMGHGFGEAALAAARYFKMRPKLDADGHPVPGGRINLPLSWVPAS